MKKTKLVLIYGGPSTEHEVSIRSADMVYKNLDRNKYQIDRLKIHKNEKWEFIGHSGKLDIGSAVAKLKIKKYDLAFIAMHGYFGEDGHIQAILESIGLKYTGSDMIASATAIDKTVSNYLYLANKFHVPSFKVLDQSVDFPKNIKFPFVIKPVAGGSSVGTFIVKRKNELEQAVKKSYLVSDRIMVQQYVSGREFTCGVLEKNGEPFALIPTEIIPKTSFFDYKAKYQIGASLEITPPKLSKRQIQNLQRLALAAHKLLGCRGMSRSDFILKGSKFYILETNTIPGLTKTSLLPQGAEAKGIDFKQLINLIVKSAHV